MEPFKRFQMISPINANGNNFGPDILDLMGSLTPAAQALFLQMKMNRDWETNVVYAEIDPDALADKKSTAYKLLSRHSREIVKSGLIVKLKKDDRRHLRLEERGDRVYYMLSPNLMKCYQTNMALAIWNSYKHSTPKSNMTVAVP